MNIRERLGKELLFLDGGMGTLLQAEGLAPGELPETWNIEHPEKVEAIHRRYYEAGSDVVLANTFGANVCKFHDDRYTVEEVIRAGIANAKRAGEQIGKETYVALDMGPTGKLLKPMGDLDFDDAYETFAEAVRYGEKYGADLIHIETMSDTYEVKAAILAAKENSSLPVFVTMIFDERGKLLTGGDVPSVVAMLEGLRVDALGLNCGLGPKQMLPILNDLRRYTSLPIIVKPNAGLPKQKNGETYYDVEPDEFARIMQEVVKGGACVIGGCCGTTPEHIHKTKLACDDIPVCEITDKNRTVISSYSHAVTFGGRPILIGERINPTGKPKFKQALKDKDLTYILSMGVAQQESRADVLDVNVGLPGIDEPQMMVDVVKELQGVLDLPLQIDTSDPVAMERALRIYNGKPLINSVNGKKEVMEQIFPLVKHYGGVVVALALDENGIPETADGRLAVARKIYETAASYGIPKKDILVDCLCMAVSSDKNGALTTLETVRRVRDELGGKTVLGVSNVSFGLPMRENINASFFLLAMQNGLSAGIVNPNLEAMMQAYDSFLVLSAQDENCAEYVGIYAPKEAEKKRQKEILKAAAVNQAAGVSGAAGAGNSNGAGNTSGTGAGAAYTGSALKKSIVKGMSQAAADAAKLALKDTDALELINTDMIPALDEVGKGFEAGTVFLPQLLMSAEAAKAAFAVVKESMEASGEVQEKKGKVILATVKGDIHDIGKNIVKVLLENYSFDVMDLGRDVPPETIVEAAVKEHVPVVGLSALMTTTVPAMEDTIKALRKDAPWVKVMVGGAVLTQEYADAIGADTYCKDAMASVNFATSVIGEA